MPSVHRSQIHDVDIPKWDVTPSPVICHRFAHVAGSERGAVYLHSALDIQTKTPLPDRGVCLFHLFSSLVGGIGGYISGVEFIPI